MTAPDNIRVRCAQAMGITEQWECSNPDCPEYGIIPEDRVVRSGKSVYCPGKPCGNDLRRTILPAYDTNLDAAWTLVEALRKEGWSFSIDSTETDCAADFWVRDTGKSAGTVRDTSPARAIALAFLAVKEGQG